MTEVHFIGSTTMNAKKDMFLSNKTNKQSFIFLLSRSLEQMVAMPDVLIAQTAIESIIAPYFEEYKSQSSSVLQHIPTRNGIKIRNSK